MKIVRSQAVVTWVSAIANAHRYDRTMTRVLIIDDDEKHCALLRTYFERFGIELDSAGEAASGLDMLQQQAHDLVLLDVMLPGRDGFEICRKIRQTSEIPVIMLTARDDVIDRVSGLELGADDYITKPFEPRELVARINTIIRRSSGPQNGSTDLLRFDGLSIDTSTRSVAVDGEPVELTSMEFELLTLMAREPGKKLSRDDMLSALRGIDSMVMTRSVDLLVSRLRRKLNDSEKPARFIHTVWGYGYVFVAPPQNHA